MKITTEEQLASRLATLDAMLVSKTLSHGSYQELKNQSIKEYTEYAKRYTNSRAIADRASWNSSVREDE
jgi:hypothetical protein